MQEFHTPRHGRPLHQIFASTFLHSLPRHSQTATMFVIGESGAGKSSLINQIFDNDRLCQVNETVTRTGSQVVFQRLSSANNQSLGLNIIDISGSFYNINDNHFSLSNRQAIMDYLQAEVNRQTLRKAGSNINYPSLILLVLKATENRLQEGKFRKSLELIKDIPSFVDTRHPNVIVAVTHAMSMGKDRKYYLQQFRVRKYQIRAMVTTILKIRGHVDVVGVENRPECYNLTTHGDFYMLPDGTYSHGTLIEMMHNLFRRNEDITALRITGKMIIANTQGSLGPPSRQRLDSTGETTFIEPEGIRRRKPETCNSLDSLKYEVNLNAEYEPDSAFLPTKTESIGDHSRFPDYCDEATKPTSSNRRLEAHRRNKVLNKICFLFSKALFFTILLMGIMFLISYKNQSVVNPKSTTTEISNVINYSFHKPTIQAYNDMGRVFSPTVKAEVIEHIIPLKNVSVPSYSAYYEYMVQWTTEKISLTISGNASQEWMKETSFIYPGNVLELHFSNHNINTSCLMHIISQFSRIRVLSLTSPKNCLDCAVYNRMNHKSKLHLYNLRILTVESNPAHDNYLGMFSERFEFPSLKALTYKFGTVTKESCQHLLYMLQPSSGHLESVSFIKTAWNLECFSESKVTFGQVRRIRLDIMSESQYASNYIPLVVKSFPNIESFQSNFGFLASNYIIGLQQARSIASLKVNVRITRGESIFDVKMLRDLLPRMESLDIKLVFDGTERCAIAGYDFMEKALHNFKVSSNCKYAKL